MGNKLTETLEKIVELALDALAEAKKEAERRRAQFKVIQGHFDMGRKKKLPPNVREIHAGLYQGRKQVNRIPVAVYGKTPEEAAKRLITAVEAETARQSALPQGGEVDSARTNFGEFLKLWRDVYKVPKIAASSLYQIDNVIKHHIPEWLKALPLCKVTPLLIQRALNEVKTDRMREYAYTVYSDSLGRACDLGYTSDVMRTVEAFKAEREPGKAMSIAHQEEFLAATDSLADERLRKLMRFYLLSGARPGEAVKLLSDDFDYNLDRVHIPGTKNKYSDRYIPFFPQLHALVDGWLPPKGARVFPFRAHYISQLVPKLLPGFTAKDLRHTFATRCKESGIATDVYKQWLGHSKSSKVAETTYTHYDNVHGIEGRKFTLYPAGVPGVSKPVSNENPAHDPENPHK